MDDRRVEQLIAAYLTGSLSESDWPELNALLDGSPEARRLLVEHFLADRLMHEAGRKPLDADRVLELVTKSGNPEFAERLLARIEADSKVESKTESGVRRGLPEKKWSTRRSLKTIRGGQNRHYLLPALAAAALLFGVFLLFSLSSSGPSRPGPGKGEVDRREHETVALKEAGNRKAEENRAQAEKARKEAEARLARLWEEEKRAEETKRTAAESQKEELKKKADEALREMVRKRMEEEERLAKLREQEEAAKQEVEKAAAPQDRRGTAVSLATVEQVEGEAFVVVDGKKTSLKTGAGLLSGQRLEMGAKSSLVIVYSDKTKVELGPETAVRELKEEGGKRLFVEKGAVKAQVAKQPKDQAMLFATPHGEAKVVGTTLRLVVDPDPKKGTKLEVEEGKVELKNLAGKAVLVESGHFAVAAVGVELAAKPRPLDEILLLPRQPKITGIEWSLVKDRKASTGFALETSATHLKAAGDIPVLGKFSSFVTYTFMADADKDYTIWIRGACLFQGTAQERWSHDSFQVELVTGHFSGAQPLYEAFDKKVYEYGDYYSASPGSYTWISGDEYRTLGKEPALSVRFSRSGVQTLRLYAWESPVRVDAIWLSTTRKTRPDDGQLGPGMSPR